MMRPPVPLLMRGAVLSALLATAQAQAAAQPMPRQLQSAGAQAVETRGNTPGGRVAGAGARVRALDTLNGTVRDIDIGLGETTRFGHLEITAEACRVPSDDAGGDAYALLRIRDIREDQPRFAGWMFASSPALSALDHPRYDVWVLSCNNR